MCFFLVPQSVIWPYKKSGQFQGNIHLGDRPDLTTLAYVKQPKRLCRRTSRDFGWAFPESRKHPGSSGRGIFLPHLQDFSSNKQFYFSALGFCLTFER